MVEKTANTLATIGKVAVVGAYVAAIGYDMYCNWNSTTATASEKTVAQEGQEEEKKQEPVQYVLDPTQDIESLTCPITMETVEEPATTVYGHLYELSALRDWVRQKGTCPLTQKPLTMDQIYPQYALKDTIAEMRRIKKENQES